MLNPREYKYSQRIPWFAETPLRCEGGHSWKAFEKYDVGFTACVRCGLIRDTNFENRTRRLVK